MTVDRRNLLKLAVGAAALEGVAAAPARSEIVRAGPKGRDYTPVIAAVRRYVELHLKTFGLPGMTVALADGDGFEASFQVGYADLDRREPLGPRHRFQIGSISKSFAAISILRQVDAGRLSLDTPAAEVLPEIPWPANSGIAVRHLLSHTSGLPDDAPVFPRGGDQRLWQGFAPGTHFSYSNLGYELLGMMVERIGGRACALDVTETFTRLRMDGAAPLLRSTDRASYAQGYEPFQKDRPVPWPPARLRQAPWTDFAKASGSVGALPQDMAHYVRWLIEAGNGRGGGVLSDPSARLLTTPVIAAPDFGPGAQYALGLAVVPVAGRPCLHHTGGMIAFSSSIHVDAPAGVGAFASVNADIDGYRPRLVTNFACQALRALREGLPPPAPMPLDLGDLAAKADDYAGAFVTAGGERIQLRAEGGRLLLGYGGRETALQQKGPEVFFAREPRFALFPFEFQREGGKVMAAWHGGDHFARDPAAREAPPVPPALQALTGRYDNDDPWRGVFRVTARGEQLYVGGTVPLFPLADGAYRVGEDATGCERVRFDGLLNGRAQRMTISGADYLRTPEGPLPT